MTDRDRVDAIETTVQKTYAWLHDLGEELGGAPRKRAYQVLRGVLHPLRDRVPVDEAAHLGAQLPMLVRGIFYEAWDPSHKPEKMSVEEFFSRVQREALIERADEAEEAARAVVRLLYTHIAPGEVDQVLDSLPREIHRALAGEHQHAV
ncbi:MAG TPA: DUF2267 domain-containing protein [Candidatus Dormibacteraeota bacterium]|jgi:uncharacterized protein (DUF2267 family)|nr:DUF2267 domain-containing protein [Candidatus Dormibacteraeota bacterium]